MSKFCYKCEKDVELVKDSGSNAQLCSVCRTILIHSASKLPEGTIIGGFEIESEIGRGGMGIVYKAKQLNLERHVALKVLADDLSEDAEFVENFFKEARAAASLNHPNIVQVFDAGSTLEGIYYFAMELIVGETLEARISRDGCLDPKEAIRIAVKIADALEYSWDNQKLTHGDIKPENIILDSSGGTKLADLGLAKSMHEDKTKGAIMATPLYAPPEIIKGHVEKISCQSDMYSFGITLFQMLSGITPFPDDTPGKVFKNHLETTPPVLSSFNPRFTPILVQLVNQLIEKDPSERPISWSDISKALKRIRQPEIEGKIFHTHHTDTSSTPISSTVISDQDKATKNLKPVIGILFAAVTGLAIAIGIIVFSDMKSSSPQETKPPAGIDLPKVEEAAEKFAVLKKQIEFFSMEQSLAQVERFIAQYGKNAPEEAHALIVKIKKQIAQNEALLIAKTAEIEDFSSKLEKLIQEIRSTNPSEDATPAEKLEKLSNDIEAVLELSSHKIYLVISHNNRETLNKAYMSLSESLIRHRQKQEEIANMLAAEERRKKLEEAKQGKEAAENKRLEEIQFNRTVDEYFIAIAKYLRDMRPEELEDALAKWSTAQTIPAAYSIKARFLLERVLPESRKLVDLMVRNIETFRGQSIPNSVCPPKLRKYTVRDIDNTGIRMTLSDGKVSFGQTLNWSSMPPKVTTTILKERLIIAQEGKTALSKEDISVVLSYILLHDHASTLEVAGMTLQDNQEENIWEAISNDFAMAENEARLADRMAQFRDLFEKGDKLGASEIIAAISSNSAGSEFAKRYAPEIKRIKDSMDSINPMIEASRMLDKCLNDAEIRKNPLQLMALCNAIEARYSGILDPGKLTEVRNIRDSALNSLTEDSPAKDPDANRVPFYYWETERIGDAWAFYKTMLDSGKMSSMPKILKSMELAAALDNGQWALAKSILDSGEALGIEELAKMPDTQAWAPSFIFARGLLAMQLADVKQRNLALTSLFSFSTRTKHPIMTPVSTILTLEYTILSRNFQRAISISSEYKYRIDATAKIEARVAFLGLLAAMDKDSSTNDEIEKMFHRLNKAFNEFPDIRGGDLQWSHMAVELIKGNDPADALIRLQKAPCTFPDLSARILLSAMARRYCTQPQRLPQHTEQLLVDTIASQIKNMPVAAESWRRLTIFNAARMNSPADFRNAMSASLNDYRLCATSTYTLAMSLKAASEIPSSIFSRMETKDNITRFLEASVMASQADSAAIEIITSEKPAAIVQRFYLDNLPDKAFQSAAMGIMANYQQPEVRASIVKVLNENYFFLTWEERFLTTQIQNWR